MEQRKCLYGNRAYIKSCLNSLLYALYFILYTYSSVFSQFKALEDNSARIMVLNGGKVDFAFNSVDKWQTGIIYNDFTVFGIQFQDSTGGTMPWELVFKPNDSNGDGLINEEAGVATLPFGVIEVRAGNALGLPSACYTAFKTMTAVDQLLAEGNAADCGPLATPCLPAARRINIDYRCGFTTTMASLNARPGYYTEDIVFTLQPSSALACP